MENQPFVSIITVCYNSERTIERTLRSVLLQKMKDYEYIIVDGQSTDSTVEILLSYEPEFEGRLKIKSEKDKGIYDAFNKGIRRATGRYIWLVNSDDYIEPDALTVLRNMLQNDGSRQILVGALNYVNSVGQILSTSIFTDQKIKDNYKRNAMIPHPATIVPSEIYEKYGVYDLRFKVAGDKDWFLRLYSQGVSFRAIPVVLTNMSIDGISGQSNFRLSAYEQRLLLMNKYQSKIKSSFYFLIWCYRYFMIWIKQKIRTIG